MPGKPTWTKLHWAPKDWAFALLSRHSLLQDTKMMYLDWFKTTRQGSRLVDVEVIQLDGTRTKLAEFHNEGRPLILNFGSCTWPPFMVNFNAFIKMAEKFQKVADFLVIYIEEAHPSDGYKFENNISIKTHRKLEDRIAAARMLLDQKPPFPVVVDNMADEANLTYGGLFERLYVIYKGVIAYEGGRGPRHYYVEHVQTWLEDYVSKQK